MIDFIIYAIMLTILGVLSFFVGGLLGVVVYNVLSLPPTPKQIMKAGIKWAIALRPHWKK
jgi:hypothetical protein